MPDLQFQVESAEATPNAASPQISFKVRITDSEPGAVHSIGLRAQVQIEPARRRYTLAEQQHLKDLFGEPERWSKTVQPLLWANAAVTVPAFEGGAIVDVPVPCTFDFNVAVTKYVYGLEHGEIPTTLLFSGTVFHAGRVGLQIAQIPWDRSATFKLPVQVWKNMMNAHYPNIAWIALRRDVFERLYEYKSSYGIPNWEQAFERMLGLAAEMKP